MKRLHKKGQIELLLILLFICGLLFVVAKSANSYESYKTDCYSVNNHNFKYNTTCSYINWTCVIDSCPSYTLPCQKTDKTGLENYCFNEYTNKIS